LHPWKALAIAWAFCHYVGIKAIMSLVHALDKAIGAEADKLIKRYHAYHNRLHIDYLRNTKRISDPPLKVVEKPDYWNLDSKYNPFYVRRKSKSISRAIARKIESREYIPNPPHIKKIPKSGGGERDVSIYQIPDAAVSTLFYNRLLYKNKHRFSLFSYAYRNDRNVHFAIQDIYIDLVQQSRTFVAEFDFSDFFGSISHDYLKEQFDQNGFYISDEERHVINAFLDTRNVGIPQGTSISLFLANLVCWELDKNLEKEGLKFARYADDTVIWSPDYTKICQAFNIINNFSNDTKIKINERKSGGISLLVRDGLPAEISPKSEIEFLGYQISVDKISIKRSVTLRIKKQISYILYKNLIQPLKGNRLRGRIIPSNNQDTAFLTAVMQIRRYLYGGLSEQYIRDYINGRTKRIAFKGLMSFYPLVNDEKQLNELDGWLLSVIYRSLQLRCKLLKKWGYDKSNSFPFNINKSDLLKMCKREKISGKSRLEIPSFKLIQKALDKGLKEYGIEDVMNPLSSRYNYWNETYHY
jgi:RNA-directed DNA polymerase